MRRRATFITDQATLNKIEDVKVDERRLSFAGLNAAREERLTFGLEELPLELQEVLRHAHELHVRWAAEDLCTSRSPYLSRISSGLHVFYIPLEGYSEDLLCHLLRKAFSSTLRCTSPSKTFITSNYLSGRFTSSSSLHYYSPLPALIDLVAYIQRSVCIRSEQTCLHTASLLNLADSLDVDYDSISHTLTLRAFWSKPPAVVYDPIGEWTTYDAWNLDVQQTNHNDRVEVGILTPGTGPSPHDLQLSGILTVLGQDEAPKPTMFHFPSRHHTIISPQANQQRYTSSITLPQGLHPTLEISFQNANEVAPPSNRPEASQCSLQAYLTLPSAIFVDEYALNANDALFAEAHKILQTVAIAGETDLEAPEYVMEKWGSTVLLDLDFPTALGRKVTQRLDQPWRIKIPLHLRYLAPSTSGFSNIDLPWPIVYWACTAEEGTKFPVNPFDRTDLGFDGLYGPRTMFYHLQPKPINGTKLVETIRVPVYSVGKIDVKNVEVGTLAVIFLGFLWILAKLWPALRVQPFEAVGYRPHGPGNKKKQ